MTSDVSSTGHCPECSEPIPPAMTLIEYRKADGSVGSFAECPACEEVVKPE